ncbi:PREDICTED: pentatricopeptide repeat-containing protein At1g74900, mitochondrial [Tarenaya hassleriana]|uniref:pentatricopeptide repeat-containing protein At1g74900, mitochondrial n=1 Tax=Tarenaya hassleriana TaxID=28532 RepID=UPI00053C49B3|nr:PREDICTED: pentatricopeptide repeat-containing protein At1g74900, mitochondrial [Tarenaya hassleriana]
MRCVFTKSFCAAAETHRRPPSPPPESAAAIAKFILSPTTTHKTLTEALISSTIKWTPSLVDSVLKRLWNHGPKALDFFNLLDRNHRVYVHAASSFDLAVDIAARLRLHSAVWSLIHRMRSLRLGPSPRTFSIVAERYASAGKPDRAVKLFLNMHEHGCFQDLSSFNTILDLLCKSKRVEKAYGLFRALRGRFSVDVVTYNVIVNGWCLVKRTPKALEVLKEMVERGINPNLTTYNTMLKGFFRAGQVDQAWKFFLEMKKRKREIDVITYTTVVHGFGVAGEIKRARNVFDEMIREGVLPSVATYNALIQVLCKKDSVENAIVVFEEMSRKGYEPNVTTYNVLIRGLCHAGQFDRSVELMQRMKKEGCEPNVQTYNIMIRYDSDCGEIDRALDLFEKMGSGDCLPNLDTYNIVISAMFVRKRPEDMVVAGKLLIEMVERGFIPRKFTFNRVLDGLLLTGNQSFAKEILRVQSKTGGRLLRQFRL